MLMQNHLLMGLHNQESGGIHIFELTLQIQGHQELLRPSDNLYTMWQ